MGYPPTGGELPSLHSYPLAGRNPIVGMLPSVEKMAQFSAPSYVIPLPIGIPFPGMVYAPWNPTFPIQPVLGANQIPTCQLAQTMSQVPTF